MPIIAATLFSGIGAPEHAMPHWQWAWCAEIEKFPSAVLAERHPHCPNLGDVTAHDFATRASAIARPDVLVFGSPCQSFSVAGKRLGLDDPRGNLALTALRVVGELRPRWFVFENVPGLLSSAGGEDFEVFLQAGQNTAPTISARTTAGGGLGTDFDCDGGLTVAKAVPARPWASHREDSDTLVPVAYGGNNTSGAQGGGKPGQSYPAAMVGSAVRRLTPTECERLQGFTDGYTLVEYRGKPAADGPRYKALGNAMAVPCVRWILSRIEAWEA